MVSTSLGLFVVFFIWKEVRRLLIEEYRPEINNLKQKLDEMRGSL